MKLLIVFVAVLGLVLAEDILVEELPAYNLPSAAFEEEWKSFKLQYNKSYKDDNEEQLRKQIFKDNKDTIDKHNARYEKGEETFVLGINPFTDLSTSEFNSQMKGYIPLNSSDELVLEYFPDPNLAVPSSFDWRQKGALTTPKQQSPCQSCWAFTTTAVVEAYHFRTTRRLVSLSEQNVMDCTNGKCQRYHYIYSLDYVMKNCIDTEQSYRYEGRKANCRFNKRTIGACIRGYSRLSVRSENDLTAALIQYGPIAVSMDSHRLNAYPGGIYVDNRCHRTSDHAVTLVGYGRKGNQDYWIVRNSWGPHWGEGGYFRMARNNGNQCNIASDAYIVY